MKTKDIVNILGTSLLIIGTVFAFLPHAVHSGFGGLIGLGEETPHEEHVMLGVATVVISLLILGYNNNAFTFWQRQ